MNQPRDVGPHWFLPHPDCEVSYLHGLMNDAPDDDYAYSPTSSLRGEWEPAIVPERMARKVASRKQRARDAANTR